MKLYKQYKDDELKIAQKIQQRRLQMLVHSCIYYKYNESIVSDYTWGKWAKELEKLQNENPKLSNELKWADDFKNWDGSSGAFLPLDDEWVDSKARQLIKLKENPIKRIQKSVQKPKKVKSNSRRLF